MDIKIKNSGEARLTTPNGGDYSLPAYSGSVGPDVIDIRKAGIARSPTQIPLTLSPVPLLEDPKVWQDLLPRL